MSFCSVACVGLFSFFATKLAFDEFQEKGLLSLGDATNLIGIIMLSIRLGSENYYFFILVAFNRYDSAVNKFLFTHF